MGTARKNIQQTWEYNRAFYLPKRYSLIYCSNQCEDLLYVNKIY